VPFDVRNQWFFDRPAVMRAVDAATRKNLAAAGGWIRKVARNSMKLVTPRREQLRQKALGKRKRITAEVKPSAPGSPPHAVQPHPFIRKFLSYAYDPQRRSVVVGPEAGRGPSNGVPALMEFGGTAKAGKARTRVRAVGGAGEIDVRDGEVVYARLLTARQVARANRLNGQLYGSSQAKSRRYPARPYMKPALEKSRDKVKNLWRDSVRPSTV
jgi:hypothetical protein